MSENILDIIENMESVVGNKIPLTMLYNEGNMLRIVLQQLEEKVIINKDLTFPDDVDWYSEALLPSPFLARSRNDNLCEKWTHADAVVGKFEIGKKRRCDLTLKDSCDFFYVIEAKMNSLLSMGTKNASQFNQVARYIACISKLIQDKGIDISVFRKLAFYVILPEYKKREKSFYNCTDKSNINETIKKRIALYSSNQDTNRFNWLLNNLDNLLEKIDVKLITWEEIINNCDQQTIKFYANCKKHNHVR